MEQDNNDIHLIVKCPHCEEFVLIEKLNCCIFRHGIIIKTGKQMNPHESKENCEVLKKKNLIYGCGKPFKIIKKNNDTNDNDLNENKKDNNYSTEICDYI
jgi:hypothetical protein